MEKKGLGVGKQVKNKPAVESAVGGAHMGSKKVLCSRGGEKLRTNSPKGRDFGGLGWFAGTIFGDDGGGRGGFWGGAKTKR